MASAVIELRQPSRTIKILKALRPRSLRQTLLVGSLALGGFLWLFPFIWTLVTSLEPNSAELVTPRLIPNQITITGYQQLFSTIPFARAAINSIGLGVVSTFLQLLTSSMAAYAFACIAFRGKQFIFLCYLATLMIPLQVLIVPLFIEMRDFHLIDTYPALLAPTIASAFGMFLIRQAMMTVPQELSEAAMIDGAGHLRIFAKVVLPQVRPALATFAIFAFMASWNSFLWPLVIVQSSAHFTLPLALAELHGQFTTEWNVVMAGSVLSILPILLVYVSVQKYVVQSIATTGLK
ncbi:MAG: carbohydrate ABC transporter permease [Acidimicrobiales bacterium]|jgi:multiple sugar transport system permease protein